MEHFVCWRCGADLAEEPLPLARAAQCRACRADLHVCRLCEFHATGIANECREPIAERVVDKTRANFCGYFKPRPAAFQANRETAAAEAALADLFAGAPGPSASPADPGAARAALEDLFKP
ncbi:MAG: hypothetical protein RL434_792 [Pseudomonadota bacterium]|jgi:hypothetical protein